VTIPPKSCELAELVDRLRSDLGGDYFSEVPYWDGDQTAVGLANPADPRFLVYLSLQPGDTAAYLECELPAGQSTPDFPYEVASSGVYTDYGQILGIIRSHLARADFA
jgi:hypothetical protein